MADVLILEWAPRAEEFHPSKARFENLERGPGAFLSLALVLCGRLACFDVLAKLCRSALLSSSSSDLLPSRPPDISLRHAPPHHAPSVAPHLAPLNSSHSLSFLASSCLLYAPIFSVCLVFLVFVLAIADDVIANWKAVCRRILECVKPPGAGLVAISQTSLSLLCSVPAIAGKGGA